MVRRRSRVKVESRSTGYPSIANFIAFVADPTSGKFHDEVVTAFLSNSDFPNEVLVGSPSEWSDNISFNQNGYQATLITDTSLFRDASYHTPEDTIERLDFDRMAVMVTGLKKMLMELVM
jgi:hypothetical protein